MKQILLIIAVIFCGLTSYAANYQNIIVPCPLNCTAVEGEFTLTSKSRIKAASADLVAPAKIFAEDAAAVLGAEPKVVTKGSAAVTLSVLKSLGEEEYTLDILPEGIAIKGGTPRAVFYGLQSLLQIVAAADVDGGAVTLAAVNISDKPHFSYRGGMLDVCRHIFSVDEVKQYIDILALHKLNKFHWHLTEDQGWRIEIKRYPELSEVGAYRNQTLIGRNRLSKNYDNTRYGGVFTQDQVRAAA